MKQVVNHLGVITVQPLPHDDQLQQEIDQHRQGIGDSYDQGVSSELLQGLVDAIPESASGGNQQRRAEKGIRRCVHIREPVPEQPATTLTTREQAFCAAIPELSDNTRDQLSSRLGNLRLSSSSAYGIHEYGSPTHEHWARMISASRGDKLVEVYHILLKDEFVADWMLIEPSAYTSFLKHIGMMLRELKKHVNRLYVQACQHWTAKYSQSEHSSESSSDDEPHPCEDLLDEAATLCACECIVSMYVAGKLCAYCLWSPEKRDRLRKSIRPEHYNLWLDRIQNCSCSDEQTSRCEEMSGSQAPRSFFYPNPTDKTAQHARSICELCTEHRQYLLTYAHDQFISGDSNMDAYIANLRCEGKDCTFNLQRLAFARLRRMADTSTPPYPHRQNSDVRQEMRRIYGTQANHLGGYPEGTSGHKHSTVWNNDPDSFPNNRSTESIVFHERIQIALANTLRPATTQEKHHRQHTEPPAGPPAEIRHLYDVQRNRNPAGPIRRASKVTQSQCKLTMTPKMMALRHWKKTRAKLQKCNTVGEIMDTLSASRRESLAGSSPGNVYYHKKLQTEAVAQLMWFAYSSYSDRDTRNKAKINIEQILQMRTMRQPGGLAEPRQTSLPGLLNSQSKAVRKCATEIRQSITVKAKGNAFKRGLLQTPNIYHDHVVSLATDMVRELIVTLYSSTGPHERTQAYDALSRALCHNQFGGNQPFWPQTDALSIDYHDRTSRRVRYHGQEHGAFTDDAPLNNEPAYVSPQDKHDNCRDMWQNMRVGALAHAEWIAVGKSEAGWKSTPSHVERMCHYKPRQFTESRQQELQMSQIGI